MNVVINPVVCRICTPPYLVTVNSFVMNRIVGAKVKSKNEKDNRIDERDAG